MSTNVVKQTTSTVFVGVDSGLNHLIRPMLYDAYHRIENVSKVSGRKRIYTVVGYICETDTFGVNRQLHEVAEGDILAFTMPVPIVLLCLPTIIQGTDQLRF